STARCLFRVKLGHSAMSAQCPVCLKVDVDPRSRDVAQMPTTDSCTAANDAPFDYVVGAGVKSATGTKQGGDPSVANTNPQIERSTAAQSRRAMDIIFQGWSMSVFQA